MGKSDSRAQAALSTSRKLSVSSSPRVLAGAAITFTVASVTLLVGYKLLKTPAGLLLGVLSGLQTQPALLGFSCDRDKGELPNVGYSTVFPLALVAKIVLAQLLAVLLM